MTRIDWNAPLELLDGTPVLLGDGLVGQNPDRDGDYWVEREDGLEIKSVESRSSYNSMCVHPDGCEEGTRMVIVRNREGHRLPDAGQIIRDLLDHAVHDRGKSDECATAVEAAEAFLAGVAA